MTKTLTVAILALVLIGGLLVFYNQKPISEAPPQTQNWSTKTDTQANVTVAVTPIEVSLDSSEWKFAVTMNTHSVELDQDLTKTAGLLVDGQDKDSKPLRWEGAPAGGHHREGVLIFPAVTGDPKYLELQIRDIGISTVRLFKWGN